MLTESEYKPNIPREHNLHYLREVVYNRQPFIVTVIPVIQGSSIVLTSKGEQQLGISKRFNNKQMLIEFTSNLGPEILGNGLTFKQRNLFFAGLVKEEIELKEVIFFYNLTKNELGNIDQIEKRTLPFDSFLNQFEEMDPRRINYETAFRTFYNNNDVGASRKGL